MAVGLGVVDWAALAAGSETVVAAAGAAEMVAEGWIALVAAAAAAD